MVQTLIVSVVMTSSLENQKSLLKNFESWMNVLSDNENVDSK